MNGLKNKLLGINISLRVTIQFEKFVISCPDQFETSILNVAGSSEEKKEVSTNNPLLLC